MYAYKVVRENFINQKQSSQSRIVYVEEPLDILGLYVGLIDPNGWYRVLEEVQEEQERRDYAETDIRS